MRDSGGDRLVGELADRRQRALGSTRERRAELGAGRLRGALAATHRLFDRLADRCELDLDAGCETTAEGLTHPGRLGAADLAVQLAVERVGDRHRLARQARLDLLAEHPTGLVTGGCGTLAKRTAELATSRHTDSRETQFDLGGELRDATLEGRDNGQERCADCFELFTVCHVPTSCGSTA